MAEGNGWRAGDGALAWWNSVVSGEPRGRGQPDAAAEVAVLYSDHAVGLTRLALVMTGSRRAADLVVQHAFNDLYRRWERVPDARTALGYARMAVLAGCRPAPRPPVRQGAPVIDVLRGLPDPDREIVILRYFLGLPDDQIAAVTGLRPDAVTAAGDRALAAVRTASARSSTPGTGTAGTSTAGTGTPGASTEIESDRLGDQIADAMREAARTVRSASIPPLRLGQVQPPARPAQASGQPRAPSQAQSTAPDLARPPALDPAPSQAVPPGPGQAAPPGPSQAMPPAPGQAAPPAPGQTVPPTPGQAAPPAPGQPVPPAPGQADAPTVADLDVEAPAGTIPALRQRLASLRPASMSTWRQRPPGKWRFDPRWLLPVAAAAVIIAAAVIAITGSGAGPNRGRTATGAAACSSQAGAKPHLAGQLPGYYLALTGTKKPFHAGIYATSSGCLIAAIAPGAGQTVAAVSAAADDRTFAIATQAYPGAGQPATTFSLLHFNSATGKASRTPLSFEVPAGATFEGFALSPDASKLAVALNPGAHEPRLTQKIKVLRIATGKVRTWESSKGTVAGQTLDPWPLSWAADGTTLAINWHGRHRLHPLFRPLRNSGLRLLSTRNPGINIGGDSRLAVRYHRLHGDWVTPTGFLSDSALITGDGTTVVAAMTAKSGPDGGFAEFSATTGKLIRRLDWQDMHRDQVGGPMAVLWTSQSGDELVVYAPPGHPHQIGIVRGRTFTPLPLPAKVIFPAAAW